MWGEQNGGDGCNGALWLAAAGIVKWGQKWCLLHTNPASCSVHSVLTRVIVLMNSDSLADYAKSVFPCTLLHVTMKKPLKDTIEAICMLLGHIYMKGPVSM